MKVKLTLPDNTEIEVDMAQEDVDKLSATQSSGMWKPQHIEDYWYIDSEGDSCITSWQDDISDHMNRLSFGNVYKTEELAETARDSVQKHNRILAWLANHDDGFVADWGDKTQSKYILKYNHYNREYSYLVRSLEEPYAPCMSEANIKELCRQLNSGEFTL